VSAAPGPKTRLGALLLRKGLVSPVELEHALETQRTKGGLLGEILVRAGLASRPAIEDALAEHVGHRVEFEAGFGTGLRSQIANRRPRRGGAVRASAPGPIKALALAPAPAPEPLSAPEPSPVLEVVPPLPVEPDEQPDLAAELAAQVEHWQRVADELREERDALRDDLARRDEPDDHEAELAALRLRLDVERAQREQAEDEAASLRAELRLEPAVATAHLVFVRAGARYALVEGDGPPPEPGTRLELDERDHVVLKVGRSPFPGDDRPCAFAEPA
jgi:hypothetical protein